MDKDQGKEDWIANLLVQLEVLEVIDVKVVPVVEDKNFTYIIKAVNLLDFIEINMKDLVVVI